nr:efflux RND transporter permease subunit [Chthoniobacterales bacterium]
MRDHDTEGKRDESRDVKAEDDGTPAAGEKTVAAKLVQFSSGLSKPFIQRPVMTMLLTMSIIVFGILTFKQLAVND